MDVFEGISLSKPQSSCPVYIFIAMGENGVTETDTAKKNMRRVHIWKKGPKMTKLKFLDLFLC